MTVKRNIKKTRDVDDDLYNRAELQNLSKDLLRRARQLSDNKIKARAFVEEAVALWKQSEDSRAVTYMLKALQELVK